MTINGSNFAALRAPAALAADYTLTLPPNVGSMGQVLSTDGSGILSWTSAGGTGDINDGGNTFGADITIGTNDNFGLNFETNATNRIQITNTGNVTINDPGVGVGLTVAGSGLTSTGTTTLTSLGLGVVQASGVGILSSSNGSDGQLLIGRTGLAPVWANLTSTGGTIAITNGAGTINLEASDATASSFPTDLGTATPVAGILNLFGGNNIRTSGAGNSVTINVFGTTNNAVQIGNASGSLTSIAVGATNTVLLGNTGGAPSFGTVPNAATTATSANTPNTIVLRDGAGDFAAGTITASLTGAASLNVLKSGDTMTGALQLPAGTAALPSLRFTGSTTTGLSVAVADTLVLSTAANNRLSINSTGAVTIAAPSSGTALNITGSINATAQTITAGTNQVGLAITGNGTANAQTITAGAGTGGGLLITGGAGSGIPLQATAAAGTGNAATFIGNATSPTLSVTSNAAQNAVITSLGAVGTPAYSFIGDTNTGMYSPGADQLNLTTGGTTRLRVDTTGSVVSQLNYKVHAYASATQGINNTTANLIFGTEVIDTNNNFTPGTGTYTAPITGFYMVIANVQTRTSNQPADVTININRNGASVTGYSTAQRIVTNNIDQSLTTMGLISLTAGDTLNISYTTNKNDTVQINGTHVTIYLVSFA